MSKWDVEVSDKVVVPEASAVIVKPGIRVGVVTPIGSLVTV